MTKLTLEQQELLFANDCKLINLRYEYHGYTGTEKWAIVTELAEEELWVKYPDVIRRYTPFILLSMAQGEVITEYQNYEARERMRRLLFGHAFDINDGEFEVHHPELAVDTDPIEEIMLKDNIKRLREVLCYLKTDTQSYITTKMIRATPDRSGKPLIPMLKQKSVKFRLSINSRPEVS